MEIFDRAGAYDYCWADEQKQIVSPYFGSKKDAEDWLTANNYQQR